MTAFAATRGTTASDRFVTMARGEGIRRTAVFRTLRALSVLGVLFLLITSLAAASAAHASTTTLKNTVSKLASTIANNNARLAAIGEHYLSEQAIAVSEQHKAFLTKSEIAAVNVEIAKDRTAVTTAAIAAYVNAGSESSLGLVVTGTPNQVAIGRAYLGFADDLFENDVTALSVDERNLAKADIIELRATETAADAAHATAADRSTVLGAVRTEQVLLSSAKGQLNRLIAAQAAAAAAAAAAAQRATLTNVAAGPPTLTAITTVATDPIPQGSLQNAFAGIRRCESSGDYGLDNGNGYYGAYQFSLGTWESLGGAGTPSEASKSAQDAAAYRLYQREGFAPWPECAAILGL